MTGINTKKSLPSTYAQRRSYPQCRRRSPCSCAWSLGWSSL